MNEKEVRRAGVLRGVKAEELKVVNAGEMLEVSYRQAKRLWARYRAAGMSGLVHRSAGRPSNRAKAEEFKKRVLGLVARKYSGEEGERFGPTLAAEHLSSEDGLRVDAETLRRWMLGEGLWSRARRRKAYRQRRERRAHFGELVQLDGSFEEWLERRGPGGCLMHIHGLEERVCAPADGEGTDRRDHPADAVRADLCTVRDPDHRGGHAAGQGASGTQPRDPSGPAD